jgi:hypothetical protein
VEVKQRLFLDGVWSYRGDLAIVQNFQRAFTIVAHPAETILSGLYNAAPLADMAANR